MHNGDMVFVRRLANQAIADDENWARTRASGEVDLLKWLESNARLPVPRVIVACPEFFVISRLSGKDLLDVYGLLNVSQKVCWWMALI